MDITPHVYSLDVKLDWFPQPYPPNVHLVRDGDEGALIDAGFSDDQSIGSRLDALKDYPGLKVRYIIITHHHFDHASGAHRLREATGARIVMHEDEAPLLQRSAAGDVPSDMDAPPERREWAERIKELREESARGAPDQTVKDGDELRVGGLSLRMVHTPGHTAGHISPFFEAERPAGQERVLFAGDNVLGMGTTAVPPPPNGDMALYVASLRKMQELNADLMYCGHGPVVREPNRKLQELIDHRREREEQILALVREGRDTVKRIVKAVYPELDPRIMGMATGQIISHLAKLEGEGVVRTEGEGEGTRVEEV